MTDIYIVTASHGEYSDRYEWVVRAYRVEEDAHDFIRKTELAARQAARDAGNWDDIYSDESNQRAKEVSAALDFPGFDPLHRDAESVSMTCVKVELR